MINTLHAKLQVSILKIWIESFVMRSRVNQSKVEHVSFSAFNLFEVNHLKRYILLKTPPESDQWFQNYEQLKDSQNNRNKRNSFLFWLYLTINTRDFQLIPLDHNTFTKLPLVNVSRTTGLYISLFALILMHFWYWLKNECELDHSIKKKMWLLFGKH